MKKIRLISLLLLFLVCFSCFVGCGSAKKSMDMEKLSLALDESQVFDDSLSSQERHVALELFGLDAGDVAACILSCSVGGGPEEYAIFEASDELAASRIADAVALRLKWQKISYGSHRPEYLPTLSGAIIRQSGVYVVYVCAKDTAGAERIITRYI